MKKTTIRNLLKLEQKMREIGKPVYLSTVYLYLQAYSSKPISMKHMAEFTGAPQRACSRTVKALDEIGFINKIPDRYRLFRVEILEGFNFDLASALSSILTIQYPNSIRRRRRRPNQN